MPRGGYAGQRRTANRQAPVSLHWGRIGQYVRWFRPDRPQAVRAVPPPGLDAVLAEQVVPAAKFATQPLPSSRRVISPRLEQRAHCRPIETCGRRCGPGRDGSESGRSVERSRLAWLFFRLPPCWGWLSNDVPTCRGLAVVWLKRGVSVTKVLELGVPATVFARLQGRSVSMAAVMIGVDPHKASHTAVAISAVEEPLGELRVRACTVQAERLLAW